MKWSCNNINIYMGYPSLICGSCEPHRGHHRTMGRTYRGQRQDNKPSDGRGVMHRSECFIRIDLIMVSSDMDVESVPWKLFLSTNWGLNKMANILQKTISNAFSLIKLVGLWMEFHWNVVLGVQVTISPYWFRQWCGVKQAASHCPNKWWSKPLMSSGITTH